MSKKLNSQDWLHIALFDQVCNLDELKQGLIANEITAALVNPTLVSAKNQV